MMKLETSIQDYALSKNETRRVNNMDDEIKLTDEERSKLLTELGEILHKLGPDEAFIVLHECVAVLCLYFKKPLDVMKEFNVRSSETLVKLLQNKTGLINMLKELKNEKQIFN